MTPETKAREIAIKLSMDMPGNWPDDKSQEKRISYIEQALITYARERVNEALEKAMNACDVPDAQYPVKTDWHRGYNTASVSHRDAIRSLKEVEK